MKKLVAWLVAWLEEQRANILTHAVIFFSIVIGGITVLLTQAACKSPLPAQYAKLETELCKARASYKIVALAAGGTLDPAPGSERAKLESAEDLFCAGLK